MNTNDTTDLQEKIRLTSLNTMAYAHVVELKDAFEKAGYTVKFMGKTPNPLAPVAPFKLQVDKGDLMTRWVHVVLVGKDRWSRKLEKLQVEYHRGSESGYSRGRGSNFSKHLRYTSLGGITERMLKNLSEDAVLAEQMRESRTKSDNAQAKAQAQHDSELNGVLLPPGAKASVVAGDGPSAGKYHVAFDKWDGIEKRDLTAEQVKKLFAVMNEIMGASELWVLRAVVPHVGADDTTVTRFYKNGDWYSIGSFSTFTKDEAARLLPEAKAKLRWDATVEMLPYSAIATVPVAAKD